MTSQYKFEITTSGRGIFDLTEQVKSYVTAGPVQTGLCHVFLHHTSASLILCENFDPLVHQDLEAFMQRLVKDGDPLFKHVEEGPDDMPSHVRSVLTQGFITMPITEHQLDLGRWQGIYLYEHRLKSHLRKMTVTLLG